MPNDAPLTLQKTRPDSSSGPPPPPYDEYPPHPIRLPDNLVLSRLAEETIQHISPVSLWFSHLSHFSFKINIWLAFECIVTSTSNDCLLFRQLAINTL